MRYSTLFEASSEEEKKGYKRSAIIGGIGGALVGAIKGHRNINAMTHYNEFKKRRSEIDNLPEEKRAEAREQLNKDLNKRTIGNTIGGILGGAAAGAGLLSGGDYLTNKIFKHMKISKYKGK